MTGKPLRTRKLTADDLSEVVRIDALHTGRRKLAYWRGVFDEYLGGDRQRRTFGVGVDAERGLAGYLFGEIRAVEFGSEPCGWVFAVSVDPAHLRLGVATALLEAATRRFRKAGVRRIRTMVERTDVPFLAFFRSRGFVGGPYVQLERTMERAR